MELGPESKHGKTPKSVCFPFQLTRCFSPTELKILQSSKLAIYPLKGVVREEELERNRSMKWKWRLCPVSGYWDPGEWLLPVPWDITFHSSLSSSTLQGVPEGCTLKCFRHCLLLLLLIHRKLPTFGTSPVSVFLGLSSGRCIFKWWAHNITHPEGRPFTSSR